MPAGTGKYTVDPGATTAQLVGKMDTATINSLLGISLPDVEVYMYPGVIKHIKRKHRGIFETFHHLIPDILLNPDYVGKNPKEPHSVELYKRLSPDLLLAIKLDPSGYLYLSSMYDLNNGETKINKRLASGRVVPYTT
jgi:hypothetical protein